MRVSDSGLEAEANNMPLEVTPPASVPTNSTEQSSEDVTAKVNELFNIKDFKFIPPPPKLESSSFDEVGMGKLFADNFEFLLRYVRDTGKWYCYINGVWAEDMGGTITRQSAKYLIEYLKAIFLNNKYVTEFSKRTKRETMIKDAQDVYAISTSHFDVASYLFNCLNGTIDLRTLELLNHNPADFLTKKANVRYNPDARYSRWDIFVDEVMNHDKELARYLQKLSGYALSGDTSGEFLIILYGPTTRNGKGTYTESVGYVLGDYSRTMQPASLALRKSSGSGPSADIARLAGARFVSVSELPSGMKLNAAMVKQLTGGDTVTARFLYQNFSEFRPQFKIYINTNHLPENVDDTLFSSERLKLIPFDRHFDDTEQDHNLKNEFRQEEAKSAILNWLLEGYTLYKAEGLTPPPERADKLLEEYRKNSDRVNLYIENRLEPRGPKDEKTKTVELHEDFLDWCAKENVEEMSLKEFVQKLKQKKLVARDGRIGHYVKDYKIKTNKSAGDESKSSKAKNSK